MLGRDNNKPPKRTGRIRLETFVNGMPRLHDIRLLLSEAAKNKGCLCELIIKAKKGTYLLSCQSDNLSSEPCFTLYEGEGTQQIWSYMDGNIEMIENVVAMTIGEEADLAELKEKGITKDHAKPLKSGGLAGWAAGKAATPANNAGGPSVAVPNAAWPQQTGDFKDWPGSGGGGGEQPTAPAAESGSDWSKPASNWGGGNSWSEQSAGWGAGASANDSSTSSAWPAELLAKPAVEPQPEPTPTPTPAPAPSYGADPYSQAGMPGAQAPQPAPGYPNPADPYGQMNPAAAGYPQMNPNMPYPQMNPAAGGYPQMNPAAPSGYTQLDPAMQANTHGGYPQMNQPAPQAMPGGYPQLDPMQAAAPAGYPQLNPVADVNPFLSPAPAATTSGAAADPKEFLSFLDTNKHLTIGELVFNANLPPKCVDAAMLLQELVCKNAIDERTAREAIKICAEGRGTLDDNVLAQAKTRAADNPDEVARMAAVILQQAGFITEQDVAKAESTAGKVGGNVGDALIANGKVDKLMLEAAQKCHELISKGSMRSDQAIIALHYCSRMRTNLEDALSDLSIEII